MTRIRDRALAVITAVLTETASANPRIPATTPSALPPPTPFLRLHPELNGKLVTPGAEKDPPQKPGLRQDPAIHPVPTPTMCHKPGVVIGMHCDQKFINQGFGLGEKR
ncbi:hypothetical protein Bbelb_306530 [Branchiostoma belcheri]|nr:hypothetical protein Bbelb_306530 [Branchiostoma belcheri]